jgi:hypothetical protein
MSKVFDIFGHTVRLARPIATSLKNYGCGLGVAEVSEDVSLVDGDRGSHEEAAVFGLRDEGANDRDAGRVGGDGVVDGVVREEGHRWTAHVMGGASDGPSSWTG